MEVSCSAHEMVIARTKSSYILQLLEIHRASRLIKYTIQKLLHTYKLHLLRTFPGYILGCISPTHAVFLTREHVKQLSSSHIVQPRFLLPHEHILLEIFKSHVKCKLMVGTIWRLKARLMTEADDSDLRTQL